MNPPDALLHAVDRPNSWIGRSRPREQAKRHAAGGGRFLDDLDPPRCLHAAFLRSPHAHARLVALNVAEAASRPDVFRVLVGTDLDPVRTPWVGVLAHFKGLKSAPQYPLARDRAVFQGEPVAMVLAASRRVAEDALPFIHAEWEPLPVLTDPEESLAATAIHAELGDNLAFTRTAETGDLQAAFAQARMVVESAFETARHTGVTLEPRGVLALWDPAEKRLTS
jgi:aerobic carbon-monoxide dehydrogenase large subunit